MAIGRNFQESMQKALRGLELGAAGFDPVVDLQAEDARSKVIRELKEPGAERIWYIADAFRLGMTVREVFELTRIDEWYLIQIEELINLEKEVATLLNRK